MLLVDWTSDVALRARGVHEDNMLCRFPHPFTGPGFQTNSGKYLDHLRFIHFTPVPSL